MKIRIRYPNVVILEREFECTPAEAAKLETMGFRQLAPFIEEKVSLSDLPSYEKLTGSSLIIDMFEGGMGQRPIVLQEPSHDTQKHPHQ